jgi:hypothetical protein
VNEVSVGGADVVDMMDIGCVGLTFNYSVDYVNL